MYVNKLKSARPFPPHPLQANPWAFDFFKKKNDQTSHHVGRKYEK